MLFLENKPHAVLCKKPFFVSLYVYFHETNKVFMWDLYHHALFALLYYALENTYTVMRNTQY